jgi:hypothetical protein
VESLPRRGRRLRLLLFAALAAAGVSCGRDIRTSAEVRDACHKDPTSACCSTMDCPESSVCDFSIACGLGSDMQISCDPGTGDRQCHTLCGPAMPCATGQTCQQRSIVESSDFGTPVSFCAAP